MNALSTVSLVTSTNATCGSTPRKATICRPPGRDPRVGLLRGVVRICQTDGNADLKRSTLLGSFFYGGMLGVFVLASRVRRCAGRGAFWGGAAGKR